MFLLFEVKQAKTTECLVRHALYEEFHVNTSVWKVPNKYYTNTQQQTS